MTDPETADRKVGAPAVDPQVDTGEGQRIADAADADSAERAPHDRPLRSVVAGELVRPVMTNDHVVVGRLFVVASLIFALGTALLGVLLRWEEMHVGIDAFGGVNAWFQMSILYEVAFMLLVLAPMLIGLAMAVVPAQIGADGLAFPRAALGAFWGWLIGSAIMIAAVFGGGGWGALDGVRPSEVEAIALTLLGTAMTIFSLLLGVLVLATTVISCRAPGMSLSGMSPFAWSILVSSVVWLFMLPVALANIVLIYTDLRGRKPISFGTPEGVDIWHQLNWITEQPAVYAVAVPVLGAAVEIVGAATGLKLRRPALLTASIGLFGLASIGGWQQDYFMDADTSALVPAVFGVLAPLAVLMPVVAADSRLRHLLAAPRLRSAKLFEAPKSLREIWTMPRFWGAGIGVLLLWGAAMMGLCQAVLRVSVQQREMSSADMYERLGIEPAGQGSLQQLELPDSLGVQYPDFDLFNFVMLASLTVAAVGLRYWSTRLFGSACTEWLGKASPRLLFLGGALLGGVSFLWEGGVGSHTVLRTAAFAGSLIAASGVCALFAAMLSAFYAQARDAFVESRR